MAIKPNINFKIMNFDKEIEDFAIRFRLVKAMNEDDMDTLRFRLKMFANDIRRKSQNK
jgi:hypothetical protein